MPRKLAFTTGINVEYEDDWSRELRIKTNMPQVNTGRPSHG